MKNIKVKKLSQGFFFSLFILQFAFGTYLIPAIVRAQEVESVDSLTTPVSEEDKVDTISKDHEDEDDEEGDDEEDNGGEDDEEGDEDNDEDDNEGDDEEGEGHNKIFICHAAGQSGNLVLLEVDDNATFGGHGNHENDIIPITDVNSDKEINQADCDYDPSEGGSCDASINLFENSGFENPTLSGGWEIYADNTPGLVWDVQWQAGSGDNTPAKAELQQIYTANSGEQYLELDSDFDGPGGSISNEPASTRISQTINTVPGQEYEISYYYSARPGYGMDDNKVGLYIDGFPWDLSVTTDGIGDSDTNWVQKLNHFTADSTSHTITFADLGMANSFGMFLDDVRVNCVEEDGGGDNKNTPPDIDVIPEIVEVYIGTICDENLIMDGVTADDLEDGNLTSEIEYAGVVDCNTLGDYEVTYDVEDFEGLPANQETRIIRVVNNDDEDENPSCKTQDIWARVVVTSYSNNGAGDVTNHIYLGSSINMLMTGEWFPVSPADLQSIENFADVPGLAVKRRNDNKIVLELHGSHLPKGAGQEYADGYIEFFNGVPTTLVGATGQNKLEPTADSEIGHADIVWINADKAYFNLGVGTADDRFSTTYVYSLDEDCEDDDGGGEDNNPPAIVLADECILWSAESFNFTSGVTTSDADGDTVTLTYVVSPDPIVFGANGTYTITYTADDGEDTTVVSKTLTIDEDCEDDNGGGGTGGGDDEGGGGGGGGSSGSILGGGGSSRQGEVLGATTTACAQFTQYHDTGSTKSEVKALQTFLNEYMDAGLTVSGVYDWATTQAVHDFQAKHWNEIIKPWLGAPSQINPNTTGRTRQTTMSAMNFIIKCPNAAMYLEDPMIMYEITEIKDEKMLSEEQIAKIVALLDEANAGLVIGDMEMGK